MFTLGAFSFIAPVALLGLVALPALWWLLRVIPPAPRRMRFPAIKLIMTLANPEQSAAKSPLWLSLLRLALVTLVILGAAHPVLNADNRLDGEGTLVLIVDDGWTAAKNWAQPDRGGPTFTLLNAISKSFCESGVAPSRAPNCEPKRARHSPC